MKERAVMDGWLGWIETFLNVDEGSKFNTEIPAVGGHFLLTGYGCIDHTVYNDIQYRPGKSSGFFMIASGLQQWNIYVCPVSYLYIHCEEQKKTILTGSLQMTSFLLPSFHVFVVYAYVQHAGAEYIGRPILLYHVHVVSKDIKLPDASEFSFDGRIEFKE